MERKVHFRNTFTFKMLIVLSSFASFALYVSLNVIEWMSEWMNEWMIIVVFGQYWFDQFQLLESWNTWRPSNTIHHEHEYNLVMVFDVHPPPQTWNDANNKQIYFGSSTT